MSTHALFVDKSGNVLLDFSPLTSAGVTIPQDCVLVRLCNDDYKYSFSGSLGQLIEITNNQYTTIGNLFRYSGTYDYVDYDLLQFQGQTINFYNHSNLFNSVPHDAGTDIYDFSMYFSGGSSGGDIDFSTIVAALNSIATALSALTNLSNLSNLADLANIITAINNKDNQSDIVDELKFIFTENYDNQRYSMLKPDINVLSSITPSNTRSRYTYSGILSRLMSLLTSNKRNLSAYFADFSNNNFRTNNQSLFEASNKTSFQNLQDISLKLQDIETKLEQNLPFTTIVENDIIETNVAQNCSYGSKIEQIPFSE